jgi:hypothetical protein
MSNSLMKLPLAGGTAIKLASDTSSILSVAVDATSVYWVTGPALKKMPIGGGTPTVLANAGASTEGAMGVAVDATSVYWIAYPPAGNGQGVILEMAK